MSRRYGRNQRRKHHAEIARLQAELALSITGGFQEATGQHPQLDDCIGGYLRVDVTESEDARSIRREASIRFIPSNRQELKEMIYTACYSGYVEWRGIVWRINLPHVHEVSYDMEVMEIELTAIGARDSTRRPVCYPEGSTITRRFFNPRSIAA